VASNASKQTVDDKLILALVGGSTITDAAALVGVSDRTVRRRMACGKFVAQLAELRGRLMDQAATQLLGGMTRAAQRLNELVESQDARTALVASKAVLSLGFLARSKLDAEALVRELQERLEQIESQQRGESW